MSYSTAEIWLIILALGAGTFLLRFSFLGLIGGRDLPPWLLKLLRYTPVAVMPGLVTPLILWPDATGGNLDPARLLAALAALAAGIWTKSIVGAVLAGLATLYLALSLLG